MHSPRRAGAAMAEGAGGPIARDQITALVLAGGRGSRMGGQDKGLLPFGATSLVGAVIAAIRPQVGSVLVNANRNLEAYAGLGAAVVRDSLDGFQGPLAGFLAGLEHSTTPYLLTLPCDGPFIGPELVPRLAAALAAAPADIAVAHDGERLQVVYALMHRRVLPELRRALAAGERKTRRWFESTRWVAVDFSDRPEQFANLNTPDEYAAARPQSPLT